MLGRTLSIGLVCFALGLSGCGSSSNNSSAARDTPATDTTGANNSETNGDAVSTDVVDSTDGPRIPAQQVSIEREVENAASGESGDPNSPSGQLSGDTEEMEVDEESSFESGIKDLAEDELQSPELTPEEGSPEWYVREIVNVLAEDLPETEKAEEIRKVQIERNRKVVELARKAIEGVHQDKKKSRVFDVAVHRMIDSQAALSLLGDPEGIDGLYDTVKSLFERDAKSKVAIDASFTLVNVAFTNAHRTAGKDNRWVKEYARLARQFSKNFPTDPRGASMLYNAALGCEWNSLVQDAAATYALLGKQYPETPQGKLIPAVQRRFKLMGEKLELTGPALGNGKEITVTGDSGKLTVVIFWSADSEDCRRVIPAIQKLQESEESLQVCGVCVDSDQKKANAFVKELGLKWPQIFFTEKESVGWKNPIVKQYGVMDVSAWISSPEGVVTSTSTPLNSLEQHLSSLLKRDAIREK